MADHLQQTQVINQSETDSDNESYERHVDYLLGLSNTLWSQMLDYEKVVNQILILEKQTKIHQTSPILLTVPGHNFRLSVCEGVKGMYEVYRIRQWDKIEETVQKIDTYSRQTRGLDLQLHISTDHGELPVVEQHDWSSLLWLLADRELSRAS